MKNKILFVQTNYPAFLDSFYSNVRDLDKLSYKEIKKLWASEYFGSSNFYSKNIKRYGWKASEIVLNDWEMQSKWAKEHSLKVNRNEIKLFKYIPQRIKNLIGLSSWVKKIFFAQIKYIKPDIIYLHDLTIFNSTELAKMKTIAKLIVGQIAYPLPLNIDVLKSYDLIISSFPHYVKRFKKMGIKSEYLRWCVDIDVINEFKNNKKVYDVSYVGGFSPHHSQGNKVLETVAKDIKINFWGYGKNFLTTGSNIRKNYKGEAWGRKMYKIFSKSKIVINRHINISGPFANNMRMFDATGMGALLITDSKKNMDEFFKVGEEVVTYDSTNDLVKKIKYYLTHDEEREKIAKAGQERTMKEHTYTKRMSELSTILKKYLKK